MPTKTADSERHGSRMKMKAAQISKAGGDFELGVFIVGGGFGGLYAAKALAGQPVEVTLVDRKNHHIFQPLLYHVALAVLGPGEIASPLRHILKEARNVRRPSTS